MQDISIRRALLSVSDKSGLVELARKLALQGVELLATGGTFRSLKESGLEVRELADYTGFPEMMDGRVKTLHPKVHGGILFRRDIPEHVASVEKHDISPIDLVVISLYPFEKTIANPDVKIEEAIEQIDIGGPSMIRSASKNHEFVCVLTDPSQYGEFLAEYASHQGKIPGWFSRKLALAAFERTSSYDRAIADYLAKTSQPAEAKSDSDLPMTLHFSYRKSSELRYGENPHQKAALYVDPAFRGPSVPNARQLHGKELSYNNLLDLESALSLVREFPRPACSIIKHNNPCGAAVADKLVDAFRKAYESDPVSAFGSVIGFNHPVDVATAEALAEPNRFVEAIIAPAFDATAIEILTTKPSWKSNVRLLAVGKLNLADASTSEMENRPIRGGLLRQSADVGPDGFEEAKGVTERWPTQTELADLEFAWAVVKHVRSNAIVLVKDEATIGVGAGQMSRVDSVQIAAKKAGDRAKGSVLASDAFFPFRDNVDEAAKCGIAAIIQPGGSKRDQESIDACNENKMAMLFAGKRHFRH